MEYSWIGSLGLVAGTLALLSGSAQAENDCAFSRYGSTLYLRADCETDETLIIPNGLVLDGRGHRIEAHDPAGGSFEGAVVRNGGSIAHVRNLTIEAKGLLAVCHPSAPEDLRLRGILLQDASGTIIDNQILAVNQGDTGCQEGAAIEVRTTPDTAVERTVTVRGNRIQGFQKTGILVLGAVDTEISLNRIVGRGPIAFIAQNGIQLSDGAHGSIRWNQVSDLVYSAEGAAGSGILVLRTSAPLDVAFNHVQETDVGIWLLAASRVSVEGNTISSSTYDGIALNGQSGTTQHNRVRSNNVMDSGSVGIDLYGAGTTKNIVGGNQVCDSGDVATQETLGAAENLVFANGCGAREVYRQ